MIELTTPTEIVLTINFLLLMLLIPTYIRIFMEENE